MVDLDSGTGGYRIAGAVVGSVPRMLGVRLGLSGRVVLWVYAYFNADTMPYQDGYFFYIMANTSILISPFLDHFSKCSPLAFQPYFRDT